MRRGAHGRYIPDAEEWAALRDAYARSGRVDELATRFGTTMATMRSLLEREGIIAPDANLRRPAERVVHPTHSILGDTQQLRRWGTSNGRTLGREPSAAEAAWLAGVFDARMNLDRKATGVIVVHVVAPDRDLIDAIREVLGSGSIADTPTGARWSLGSRRALVRLVDLMIPHARSRRRLWERLRADLADRDAIAIASRSAAAK
jgi:hypothetical protein